MRLRHFVSSFLAIAATYGQAQNYVTNGEFDTNLAGWTHTPANGGYGIYETGPGGGIDNWTGSMAAAGTGYEGTISQTLALTVGETYTLSFYAAVADNRTGAEVDVSIGNLYASVYPVYKAGQSLSELTDWTLYSTSFKATSNNLLYFHLYDPPDAVAITHVGVIPQAVPEPPTIIVGLGLTGLIRRRTWSFLRRSGRR